jgi:PadR family transcriptional regulator PadR
MNIDNTQAQMRKGILEFCILNILSTQEAYPSEILEQLKKAKLIVVEGTLYPLLTRLKNSELPTAGKNRLRAHHGNIIPSLRLE